MKTSVVIPTLGRQEGLKDVVSCLLAGTVVPDEIVIIEQGDVYLTRETMRKLESRVPIHVFFEAEASLSVARNRGIKESSGELIFFFDDDMEIELDFIEVAVKYFISHPETLGATGSYMRSEPAWTLKRIIGVFFCVYSLRQQNVVLPSGSYDYVRGKKLSSQQPAQWLYGGNIIIRRSVFAEGLRFNEDFKRWAFGEDVMFTYQIHKRYPGSLVYLPDLRIRHLQGVENKMLNTPALRMKIIYRYVFWKQEVWNRSIINTMAYIWSQVGLVGLELLQHPSLETLEIMVKSYWYISLNRKFMVAEDYNKFVFSE